LNKIDTLKKSFKRLNNDLPKDLIEWVKNRLEKLQIDIVIKIKNNEYRLTGPEVLCGEDELNAGEQAFEEVSRSLQLLGGQFMLENDKVNKMLADSYKEENPNYSAPTRIASLR
jgi:hypothetical protein